MLLVASSAEIDCAKDRKWIPFPAAMPTGFR